MKKQLWTIDNKANHNFKSNNFYVYELVNPITNLPFYVGKGRDNRAWKQIQLRNNIKESKYNPHKYNTIKKLINDQQVIIIRIVLSTLNEQEAFEVEQDLIATYKRVNEGGILTNICRGGEGSTVNGKPVSKFTKWGDFVCTYPNAKEAARINGWKHYSVICSCCKGREKSYQGWLWAYEGNVPSLLTKNKPVYKWDMFGNLIQIYDNASVAARAHSCDPSTILDCVAGNIKTAMGHIWTNKKEFKAPNIIVRTKRVRHNETGIIYNSVTAAAKATNHTIQSVSFCCNGKRTKVGSDTFSYAEDASDVQ